VTTAFSTAALKHRLHLCDASTATPTATPTATRKRFISLTTIRCDPSRPVGCLLPGRSLCRVLHPTMCKNCCTAGARSHQCYLRADTPGLSIRGQTWHPWRALSRDSGLLLIVSELSKRCGKSILTVEVGVAKGMRSRIIERMKRCLKTQYSARSMAQAWIHPHPRSRYLEAVLVAIPAAKRARISFSFPAALYLFRLVDLMETSDPTKIYSVSGVERANEDCLSSALPKVSSVDR
jgi:hypothetical protein